MTTDNYILQGHTPVPEPDLMKWAAWQEREREARRVALDKVGEVTISTVFLAMNHGWGEEKPVLFETMVFGGPLDEEQERYTTWEEAEEGHKRMVACVRRGSLL